VVAAAACVRLRAHGAMEERKGKEKEVDRQAVAGEIHQQQTKIFFCYLGISESYHARTIDPTKLLLHLFLLLPLFSS
jgi:hypothetical protein